MNDISVKLNMMEKQQISDAVVRWQTKQSRRMKHLEDEKQKV